MTTLGKIWLTIQAGLNWIVWLVVGYTFIIISLDSSSASLVNGPMEFFYGLTFLVFIVQLYGLFLIWSGVESKYSKYQKQFVHAPSWCFLILVLIFVIISIVMSWN